jgi:hypothetical protein
MYIAFEKYTRDEFLEEHVRSNCPSDFGLEDIDYDTCTGGDIEQCQGCWNEAIKDIEFKNDIVAFEEQAINILNNLATVEKDYKKISNSRDKLKKSLLEMMEDYGVDKFENDNISITYVKNGTSNTFDSKNFKIDYPNMYEEYVKTSSRAASVRFKLK